MIPKINCATHFVYQTTLAVGSYPFLLRERTSVTVGHVAPIVWELTRISPKGGVVKCQIVMTVVDMMQYYTKGFKATESLSHFVIPIALCNKKEMDSLWTKYTQ